MEVIKQVVYLVLVMCIIYLVFYLLTYRTDQHANLDTGLKISKPKINMPKVNIDMPDGKIIDMPERIVQSGQKIVSSGGSSSRGGHFGDTQATQKSHDWDHSPTTITREGTMSTSHGGIATKKNARYTGAHMGRRTYSRGGMHGQYEGPLLNGKPEGFGVFRYNRKNDMYIGEYVNGKRHGKGYSFFRSGKIMEREYFNNELERETKMKYRYNVRTLTDGSNGKRGKYEGAMKSSKPHGLGTIMYKDGSVYVGWFSRGQKHGNGNLIESNGEVISQEWSDGTQIR